MHFFRDFAAYMNDVCAVSRQPVGNYGQDVCYARTNWGRLHNQLALGQTCMSNMSGISIMLF